MPGREYYREHGSEAIGGDRLDQIPQCRSQPNWKNKKGRSVSLRSWSPAAPARSDRRWSETSSRGRDEIRVLSRDEAKQDDMRREFSDSRLRFFLGDVRDIESVREAAEGVDHVFHAAALKQVPSCEFFPMQAVRPTSGQQQRHQGRAAAGVKSVVCLSTDKAVYPINAMGISKAHDGKGRAGIRPEQP